MTHGISGWSSSSTSGYRPDRVQSGDPNSNVHSLVHSGGAHDTQKAEATQASTDRGWGHSVWSTATMEHYPDSKRKEVLPPATTWMGPGDTVLSEQAGHKRTRAV